MKQSDMIEPTYLYHQKYRDGQVFDAQSDEFEGLAAEGWVDTPAKLSTGASQPGTDKGLTPSHDVSASLEAVKFVVPTAAVAPISVGMGTPSTEAIDKAVETITDLEQHRTLLTRFSESGDSLDKEDLLDLARLQGIKNLTRRNSPENIEAAILESMRNEPDGDNEEAD